MAYDDKNNSPGDLIGKAAKTVAQETAKEVWTWARWAGWGAVLGGVAGGGAGLYYFGLTGLGIGLIGGVILGAVGAWLLYISMQINM